MRRVSALAAAGFAFAGGCALARYVLPGDWLLWAAAALIAPLAAGAALLRERRRRNCVLICLFAALALVWYGAYSGIYMGAAAGYADTTGTVSARVLEYPYRDGDEYASVAVKLAEPGSPRLGVAVSDYSGTLPELRPGDKVELTLEFIDAAEKYGDPTDVYASRGTHLRAYFVSAGEPERDALSALYFPQELNHLLGGAVERVFPEDVRGFMKGLLIGETQGIYADDELDNALAITGVAHVISVSGMHLTFLYLAMLSLFGRRRAAIFGAPLVIVFTLMAGCTPACVRACVMLLLSMLGTLLNREADDLTSLGLALLLLLGANPMSVANLGLQLSFGSMLGMVLISPHIDLRLRRLWPGKGVKGWRRPVRAFIISNTTASLGASVFTVPLVAAQFGYVSLISFAANLLTMWAISLAFTLGLSSALIALAFAPLGAAAAWCAAWPARYFVRMIELLARAPFAAVYTADGTVVVWLVFTYAVFILALVLRRRGKKLRWAVPALCSVIVLAAVIYASDAAGREERAVTVLDVGQGQCVALLAGDGAAVVDCGGIMTWDDAGDTAAEYFLSRGRHELDALILTHLHRDHAGGAARLIYRLDVGTLYLPADCDDADSELEGILAACEARGTGVVRLSDDLELAVGDMTLTMLAPVGTGGDNERGLAVRADIGGLSAVMTGDASMGAERLFAESGKLDNADVLVVGHHGSRYSSSFELIDAVRPSVAVVSVGYNSYGHPTEDALARVMTSGAEVYRTDENGSVTIRTDEYGEEGR